MSPSMGSPVLRTAVRCPRVAPPLDNRPSRRVVGPPETLERGAGPGAVSKKVPGSSTWHFLKVKVVERRPPQEGVSLWMAEQKIR